MTQNIFDIMKDALESILSILFSPYFLSGFLTGLVLIVLSEGPESVAKVFTGLILLGGLFILSLIIKVTKK